MYSLKYSKVFKKDLKKIAKQDKSAINELKKVLGLLILDKQLDQKYKNHCLKGEFKKCFECHIKSDVLLIYKIEKQELIILLLRIGSHSNLF
ncbi:type II toxin-antitoxin system YafQ family toxin [Patescibacteria group bacterium]|nr:type II toxin-antitoxin system YafQ family toxin [Patescibacteria group bacterium]MBU4601357.1 type II toxin-antitoxin system YafQ family toxin [Patescibacteria group bacterium]